MYPYISREDCYYTDTDSVVLGQPLPKEVISSSVLGKFKLEDRIMKGYFLAPKSYFYIAKDGTNVLKYKGPAKTQVYPEWFKSQYADPSRTELVPVEANFRIDWHTLNINKKDTLVRLGITLGTKRIPVYHRDVWVDTDPIDINDLSCLDHIGKQIIQFLKNDVIQLQTEKKILNEKLSQKEREIAERYKEMFDAKKNTEEQVMLPLTERPRVNEERQPSLHPDKKEKGKNEKGKKEKGKKEKGKKEKHKKR
ncbi:hypothetical protein Pint_32808 [Pistacia integerrima]|uniref:Uncharacterized protein n=1 Tax=Pistacia integerrima TaxID=434235 RepID=A0ACC0X697_9ROSI|nr:hypothetical protein Pint_32808 [Pistacia integerrima]